MSEAKRLNESWKFKSADEENWFPAVVPGCVHTDLLRNERISDPFYGTNEGELQWIDKKDWEYSSVFDVPDDILNSSYVNLVFAGLDTYADVYLNDEKILSADNMFRTWRVDVKRLIKAESNALRVYFRSPIQEDLPKLERLGYALPATNDQSERGGLGDKKLSVFARKAPYHYGWDWGPRFVTSGIWRDVWLEGWSQARIADVFIHQKEVNAAIAKLTAVVEIESEDAWEGALHLVADGIDVTETVRLEAGVNKVEVDVVVESPKLWWSRGLGDQNLYTFSVTLVDGNTAIAEKSVRTGLRSVRLVRDEDDQGTSFYFELNGVPVFAKGANHIPNDSFLTDVSYERYKHEIVSAVESNMNMLRVWGGGFYENDDFYDLCDEYGLLVWQDFMFACSMYPGDEAFLNSVRSEAEENVTRLRNHPSIALWCGNNEIDTAWSEYDEEGGWGWKQQYAPETREKIWRDYEAIFHETLPQVVQSFAPGAEYWPSSPMQALTRDKDQHARNDSSVGDIHYWGVWHAVEPFSNYNVYLGRFMSEYGFQSFPELKTVQSYASAGDMALESDVMRWHQRSGDGNRLIKEYMDIYFKQPKDFPSFLYMSQVLQAEAIKMAMEAHRRKKPYCMGTLYWQMNDCWPVASWSSMDYYGRWKALQYYAKKSLRDVAVSIGGTDEVIDIHIISDVLHETKGNVHLQLFDFKGLLLKEYTHAVEVKGNTGQVVLSLSASDLVENHARNDVVLFVTLEQDGEVIDAKEHYFVPANQIALPLPSITATPVEGGDGSSFILETDVLAKSVCVTSDFEGIFSDNYFDLIPGVPKTVQFLQRRPGENTFNPAAPGPITIRSMADFIVQ
ncbi:beta-mannosidase [Alicyclobacillus fastidiosus]|uniref:Beta-mannosidase n=1 Tax=Alicyclobacillus fastidiosus TaxID=392011 RepID=A0ABV5ALY8_9BACL|nr:glycoside hydrolase family 2 protein [Alicyclobacillus fastidiosus]WEH09960.1 glycoside hydrolase family 2 TIM barrel-domain containing protein [Alicyclobacillus fastidiosus]